jgi:hypothetical protein
VNKVPWCRLLSLYTKGKIKRSIELSKNSYCNPTRPFSYLLLMEKGNIESYILVLSLYWYGLHEVAFI